MNTKQNIKQSKVMKVPELLARYNLNSRAALYNRLKALRMRYKRDENNKAFVNEEQLEVLDMLHQHLMEGGKLSNFVRNSPVSVISPYNEQLTVQSSEQISGQSTVQETSSFILLEKLVGAIASNFNAKSPLKVHQDLAEAEAAGFLLTTNEVEEVVGRKPRKMKGSDSCQVGGWRFVNVGKAGNKLLWKVQKVQI
ncbi:hypothetical protein [Okeania sp. SIO1I7]|uniref:hypothetical protein n=1 Tax=Okeania sp. SIO1I7 TaxID=2607772 RepID=UPI0013F8CEBB|nr:hypothetical protein [Okeania sp. SIO1I7]NET29504.1 hypothetical protein [Okeania sp. SIO1I7]